MISRAISEMDAEKVFQKFNVINKQKSELMVDIENNIESKVIVQLSEAFQVGGLKGCDEIYYDRSSRS